MFDKIESLDLDSVLSNLRPFVSDSAQIADWSKDMFRYFVGETQTILNK